MRVIARRVVKCQFEVEGFHRWKDAPQDLSYLRNDHRHMFYVKVTVEVTHNDRDVEIITLKHYAKRVFENFGQYHMGYNALHFNNASCEAMASYLGFALVQEGYAVTLVTVLEDNENGASIFFREADVEHIVGSTEK